MELLPQTAAPAEAGQQTLWHCAPGWRNLTVAASLLTLAAVAIPPLLPQERNVRAPVVPAPLETVSATPSVTLAPPPAVATAQRRASSRLAAPLEPNPAMPITGIVAAPPLQSAPGESVCNLRQQAPAPVLIGLGTITGVEDRAEAQARIQISEANSGGKIDPAYIDNTRVIVRRANGQTTIFILPKGMNVAIGDRVTLQNAYRNTALPCNYVPIMIASDLGPPPPPGTAQ